LQAQKIATKPIKLDPFYANNLFLVENGDRSYIISKFKTSNREYLCFLQWTYRVYGSTNMSVYRDMLPDTTASKDVFDPAKANQPVKGLTKKQALAFCQWRSDRLNEYILIREGILIKDFQQRNEEHFNTESYLAFQYGGMVKNDLYDKYTKSARTVLHSDFILLPAFYLASNEQIRCCDSLYKAQHLEAAKKVESDLDWWLQAEFEMLKYADELSPLKIYTSKLAGVSLDTPGKIKSYIKKLQQDLATQTIDFSTSGVMISNRDLRGAELYKYKTEMRYFKYLADSLPNPFLMSSPQTEIKNKFGELNYIYMADNADGTPICINRSALEFISGDDLANNGFYCAMNIPYRLYWKLQEFWLINYSQHLYRY
jgi:hypothetical protein